MNGEVMNVVLFMMRQLNDLKMDKNQNLAYAPYIMALIKAKTRFEGHCEIVHTPFRPFKNEIGFLTKPQQYWQPGPGYFDPYFQNMQQGLQTHMDGCFQGMMTHMDQRMDAMQSRFDDNLDAINFELSEFRSHIQDHVTDPIMTRPNNMRQSFQDNMGGSV
jgi:hypothetical protein